MNSVDKYAWILWALVLSIYTFTAWNSHGYYHADEHFQIIEFANYKLGNIGSDKLTWEFVEQMRPSVQPFIFSLIDRLGNMIGLDVFSIVRLSRLLTVFLFLIFLLMAVRRFGNSLLLISLLWFMPSLMCRFSSETWAAIFLGYALLLKPSGWSSWLLIGVMLGMSFVTRFQMGISILALGLYWLATRKATITNLGYCFAGGLIPLAWMVLADHWMYSEWVFTPWEYLDVNIFQNVVNEKFGTKPWYAYFQWIFEKSLFLPGIVLVTSLVIYLVKMKRFDAFAWAVIPFVIVHFLIGHKELRFLFPMLSLVLLMLVQVINELPVFKKVVLYSTLLMMPIVGYCSLRPMKHEIASIKIASDLNLALCYSKDDPMNPFGAPFYYYQSSGVITTKVEDLNKCNLIYCERKQAPFGYSTLFQQTPNWIVENLGFGGWPNRTTIVGVYEKPME